MKASDYIAKFIKAQKIDVVFEMAGGMITHILDSLGKYNDIKVISMHHEQSASFAADAFGRITGKPGIALATSGPGATNLITGIGSCYFDSVPAIFITGQVNLHEKKGKRNIRQLGFQETDIINIVRPITKAAYEVTNAKEIPSILKEAYQIAIAGRPGPVLIDIPMNLQREDLDDEPIEEIHKSFAKKKIHNLTSIAEALQSAQKPVILAGGGIKASCSMKLFCDFVTKTQLPVISSLLAVDLLPYNSPQRIGFLGSYGNRWANLAIGEADVILVLGSRLDIRQTGADTKFLSSKTIIHVDCEEGEINNRIAVEIDVNTDLNNFFEQALEEWSNEMFEKKQDWYNEIQRLKNQWPDVKELLNCKGINPNQFMHELSKYALENKVWITDVGNHQMWAAQSLEVQEGQYFLTSGGMGAMGFSLPAGIGASLALKNQPVVVIAGDGGFQLNIQELQTIVRNRLPVKMVIINNQSLGMIRQFQDSYFNSKYQSTYLGYSAPDFEKVAQAYGIESKTISETQEVEEACKWLWQYKEEQEPKLLQVMVDTHTNAYPKIAFGRPLTEMEPFAKPLEMEGT